MLENIDKLISVKSGVHNEEQLADFMAQEQSIREDFDTI